MIAQALLTVILLLLEHRATSATNNWPTSTYSELNVTLQGFTLESFNVNSIFECYEKCEENMLCSSINLNLTDKTCEMKYSTKTKHPEKIVHGKNTIYMQIRDRFTPGLEPHYPIDSCKHHKQNHSYVKSGVYWMKFNEPSSAPFQVFCDMTTDGGGWTLVYSYTFIHYSSFSLESNAVTPIPTWPVSWSASDWVPQSTTIPLNESSRSAMDFSLWKKIGTEFLIKPNITNWVACVEGTGSLVNWEAGSVTCKVVKAITQSCTNVAPDGLFFHDCGVGFRKTSKVLLFFEGNTAMCWPVHDPCSTTSASNHVTNVLNAGGAIYIR